MRHQAVRLLGTLGLLLAMAAAVPAGAVSADPTAGEGASPRHRVDVTAMTRSVGSPAPGTIKDRGTTSGRPFGPGTITLLATFEEGQKMNGTFKIHSAQGSAAGTMATTYVIQGSEITFTGTATFTGGTGRYRGITGKHLKAYDHNTLDGQSGMVTLKGFSRF